MPKPPAEFSPLTMTRSSDQSLTMPGKMFDDGGAAGLADDVTDEEDTQI